MKAKNINRILFFKFISLQNKINIYIIYTLYLKLTQIELILSIFFIFQ